MRKCVEDVNATLDELATSAGADADAALERKDREEAAVTTALRELQTAIDDLGNEGGSLEHGRKRVDLARNRVQAAQRSLEDARAQLHAAQASVTSVKDMIAVVRALRDTKARDDCDLLRETLHGLADRGLSAAEGLLEHLVQRDSWWGVRSGE